MIVRSGNKKYLPIDAKPLIDYAEKYGMQVDPNGFRVNQLIDITKIVFSEFTQSNLTATINGASLTINGTSSRNTNIPFNEIGRTPYDRIYSNHKYLIVLFGYENGVVEFHTFNRRLVTSEIWDGTEFNPNARYPRLCVNVGVTYNNKVVRTIFRDLTEIFGAGNEPTLQWIEANRPDLLQNTDYIPNTITIEPKTMEVK